MKRRVVVVIAVLVLVVSGILVVSKSSYAYSSPHYSQCPNGIYFEIDENREEVYAQNNVNKIDLPYGRLYLNYQPVSSDIQDYRLFLTTGFIFDKYFRQYSDSNFEYRVDRYFYGTDDVSILANYLVSDTYFSDDKDEDDYYKQLLVLWAMDRLAGFSDDVNYIYDYDSDEVLETDVDTKYDDKYILDGDYEEGFYYGFYYWKYVNNLSVGDKKLLKKSKYGDKMLEYLDTWDDYVTWYVDQNRKVELDSLTQSDISYHATNEYVETGLITPTSTGKVYSDKFSGYTVDVESPMIVVNQNGEEETSFDAGDSFKVRIPISEIENNNIDYSIHINGEFEFDALKIYSYDGGPKRYEYPSEQRMELYMMLNSTSFTRNCKTTQTLDADLNLEFSQRIGNLNVKVIDSSTGNNLSRAEVTIYDLKGNEVYKYETTDSELNITLPVGEYIVKQTVTPPNYEAQTIQMRVDVTEDGTVNAVLENAPLIDVPDTAMNSIIFVIIGGLIVIAGGLLLFTNLRKRKVN